jgi:hypothetical protein
MADPVTTEELAEAMYHMVEESAGSRRLRPTDLTKAMIERFGPERCTRESCKAALRTLVDTDRCVYTFYDGSYVELPSKEQDGAGA